MTTYWRFRTFLGRYPALFYPVYGFKATVRKLRVRRDTELVVEGYPRSANSFAAHIMLDRHPGIRLAHHLHVPAQILRGVEYGVPVCLVIRKPSDAVASFLVFSPDVSMDAALDDYISFHRAIRPYRDRFVVADFSESIGDFGQVVKRINTRFGTRFDASPVAEPETDKAFGAMESGAAEKHKRPEDRVGRPSEARRARKQDIIEKLPGGKLEEAEKLYRDFVTDDA